MRLGAVGFCAQQGAFRSPNILAVFASDQNIDSITKLVAALKRYAELRGRSLRLVFVEKLSVLLAAVMAVAVVAVIAAVVVLLLSFCAAVFIAPYTGGLAGGLGVMALLYAFVGWLVWLRRHAWIEAPIVGFLARLLLDDEEGGAGK